MPGDGIGARNPRKPGSLQHLLFCGLCAAAVSFRDTTVIAGDERQPGIQVLEPMVDAAVAAYRRGLTEARPGLRGFRAPLLGAAHQPWPINPPEAGRPPELRRAAAMVSARLAFDGLPSVLVEVINMLGPNRFLGPDSTAIDDLQAVGLPIDLLRFFSIDERQAPEGREDRPSAIVGQIARLLDAGEPVESVRRRAATARFEFRQSADGFRVATESGEHALAGFRLQLARGTDWAGVGDGGSLDVARQLAAVLPDATCIISIERRHVDDLLHQAQRWSRQRSGPLIIIPEELAVAQWAQDNAKAGFVVLPASAGGSVRPAALLAPRYASRGEDGSTFVPGETFLLDHLPAAGLTVTQSPLLFQGGDLMPLLEPRSGERIMLVGEAQVYRNIALGLTREQTLQAMRIEFGVDRCEVLPAVSFHLDYEVSVRSHQGRLAAFVNDTAAAVRVILQQAAKALLAQRLIDSHAAARTHAALDQARLDQALEVLMPAIWQQADARGHFPLPFAERFSTGPVDSGIGNLHRILVALDLATAEVGDAAALINHGHWQAYLRSFARREDDRAILHRRLRDLGLDVVPVPSLSEGDRSMNVLNGVHVPGTYLMPAYGGLLGDALDAAAAAAFAARLGPAVRIVPILCGESQRRHGAIRCSVNSIPRP